MEEGTSDNCTFQGSIVGRGSVAVRTSRSQSREPGFESSCCHFEALSISSIPRCHSSNSSICLLIKVKAHGIGDGIIYGIEQWLTDRRQRVVVDGEVSNWKSVLSGVPQESVLGHKTFADDTKVFRKVNTDGDKQHLQNDLERLVKWS